MFRHAFLALRGAVLALVAVLAGVAASPSLAVSQSQAADIDNAGQPLNALDPSNGSWRFSNGREFAGAKGSFAVVNGQMGPQGVLGYDFGTRETGKKGRYVAAYWRPPAPLDVDAQAVLRFRVMASSNVSVRVRVTDESGQTLQMDAVPVSSVDTSKGWADFQALIGKPSAGYFGGANNGRLSGRVTEIGILAVANGPSQGKLYFSALSLSHLRGSRTAVSSEPAVQSTVAQANQIAGPFNGGRAFNLTPDFSVTPAPESARSLASRLGVNIHFVNNNKALDLAKSAGFSFVRMDLTWSHVEQHGSYDFTNFDKLLAALEARNMSVLWILCYGHPDHGGNKTPTSYDDQVAFARYAAASVAHYKGHNVRYEIWNEQNDKRSIWADPKKYAKFLDLVVPAMRREDPNVQITSGGVEGVDQYYLKVTLQSDAGKDLVAVGVHPYRRNSAPENALNSLRELRNRMDNQLGAREKAIWDTEWGYSSYGYFPSAKYGDGHSPTAWRRQAVYAVRELLTVWIADLPIEVWYDIADDGNDPRNEEHNFGLYSSSLAPKPAATAVTFLSRIAENRSFDGLLNGLPSGMYGMHLSGSSGPISIIWDTSSGDDRLVEIPGGRVAQVYDMYGEPAKVAQGTNGLQLQMREEDGPIYVVWR